MGFECTIIICENQRIIPQIPVELSLFFPNIIYWGISPASSMICGANHQLTACEALKKRDGVTLLERFPSSLTKINSQN